MEASTVWIIIGRTGEYSDRTEWCVRVFDTEAAAVDYRTMLLNTYRHAIVERPNEMEYEARERVAGEMSGGPDPSLPHIDYTGLDYTIVKAPMGEGWWR